nr:bifunctional diguanylate cyclase/phosphodiesterase [uncultured Deefgea sp.]
MKKSTEVFIPRLLQRLTAQVGVYFLFAIAMALGLFMSVLMLQSGDRVNAVTQPLVMRLVPSLHDISDLKTLITERQVILNQYFAYGLNQEQFKEKLQVSNERIQALIDKARSKWKTEPQHIALLASFENSKLVAEQLDQTMSAPTPDLDEARALLVENEIDTRSMLDLLDESFLLASQNIKRAGQVSAQEVQDMIRLVLTYSLVILIISILVAYYIHARQRAENRLAYAARHDRLTDLLNRSVFESDLANLNQQPHAAILISIDRFQRVLGGLGYEAGDELVVAVKDRLLSIVKQMGGTLYRFEGTHFAALFALNQPLYPQNLLPYQALLNALNEAIHVAGHELFATLSMGGAMYPKDGDNAITLIRNMDAALEVVQAQGGNASQCYSLEMNARAVERLALEAELRYAVERDELLLYFQPQTLIPSLKVIGVECLVRWQHQGKLVPPFEFIPLAEESGLIIPIGEWILRTACQQAKAWQAQGMPLVVAINISARQFQHPKFFALVQQVLAETAVDPQLIELEITEGVVMQDADHPIELLQRLRGLGVMLSIDDFGTGYSSLSYLKRFPINKLKIDQSFVRDMDSDQGDAAIVEAIIRLGHSLGLTVIAEGVETAAHLAALAQLECDELQGYYFSRPLPAADAQAFLHKKLLSESTQSV